MIKIILPVLVCFSAINVYADEVLPVDANLLASATVNKAICTNCPDISKIADRENFDDSLYYANTHAADNLDISGFKTALSQDISAVHKQLTYSEVWTALTYTDEDPNNSSNVILIYKGNSIPKNHNASGVNDQDYWNREHVWAKSHGFPGKSQHGYTDIHHLRPSDMSMNSARGNNDFDIGGNAVSEAPDNLKNGALSWEPRDAVKGDVARMMFYMDTRYEVGSDDDMPDLLLVDRVGTSTSSSLTSAGEMGKLCTLLEWHAVDPVDNFERDRNNSIFEYQGNRNPYIDHPEWTEIVYKDVCGSAIITPVVTIAAITPVKEGEAVNIVAQSNIDGVSFLWQQISGAPVTIAQLNTASLNFVAPEVDADSELGFKVTMTDSFGSTANDTVILSIKDKPLTLSIMAVSVVYEGNKVSLKSASNGVDASYLWQQIAGSTVTITDTTKPQLEFTAPQVTGAESISFSLTVTDMKGETVTQTVVLTVNDKIVTTPPTDPEVTPPTEDTSSSGGALHYLWGLLLATGVIVRRKY